MLRGFATITYLADDLDAARRWYAELLEAESYYLTASVIDPFGNALGIMDNPHDLEMVGR